MTNFHQHQGMWLLDNEDICCIYISGHYLHLLRFTFAEGDHCTYFSDIDIATLKLSSVKDSSIRNVLGADIVRRCDITSEVKYELMPLYLNDYDRSENWTAIVHSCITDLDLNIQLSYDT